MTRYHSTTAGSSALCVLLGCLAAAQGGCGSSGAATTGGTAAPTLVTWRYPGGEARPPVLAFQSPPKPRKGASVVDPLYHASITRVTDRAADRYDADGLVNEYARADPENADGTRVLLRGTNGNWYLYSVPGFQLLRQVAFRGNPDPEPRWDATDAGAIYFVEGPSLWRHSTGTNQDTLVHNFSQVEPRCAFVRTRYEGDASLDRRFWCLRLEDADFHILRVVCYDKQANKVVGQLAQPDPESDSVSMDMSGTHCLIGGSDTTPPLAYHRDFTHRVQLPAGSLGHADLALDASGRDVLVYQNTATDWIAMADLETGTETNLVPIPFADNTDIGLHISGNCQAKRGWVLVSTYGQNAVAKSWMDRSLFMLELKARPAIWRLAQTFCLQDAGVEKDYFAEAFAAINTRGTRVWWGSNWNATGATARAHDTYYAALPDGWDGVVRAAAP